MAKQGRRFKTGTSRGQQEAKQNYDQRICIQRPGNGASERRKAAKDSNKSGQKTIGEAGGAQRRP